MQDFFAGISGSYVPVVPCAPCGCSDSEARFSQMVWDMTRECRWRPAPEGETERLLRAEEVQYTGGISLVDPSDDDALPIEGTIRILRFKDGYHGIAQFEIEGQTVSILCTIFGDYVKIREDSISGAVLRAMAQQ